MRVAELCMQCGQRNAKQEGRCWGCLGDYTEWVIAKMKSDKKKSDENEMALRWMGSVLAIIRWRERMEESSYAK